MQRATPAAWPMPLAARAVSIALFWSDSEDRKFNGVFETADK